jgi:hypothetical protein
MLILYASQTINKRRGQLENLGWHSGPEKKYEQGHMIQLQNELMNFLYIFIFFTILQKYMVHCKFSKNIHLPPWPSAVGAARSGPVACPDLALNATAFEPSAVGRGVRTQCRGPRRQQAT